jgi:cell division septation protein DedD
VLGLLATLLLLALAGCSGDSTPRVETPIGANPTGGPDPIVLRVALDGGPVRAYRYPRLDTLIWSSSARTGAPGSVLAFDQENGLLALLDQRGIASWVDLRVGQITPSARTRLEHLSSADAWAIYGVVRDTTVRRMTPSGEWAFSPGGSVAELFPQSDGDLVVMVTADDGTRLLRLRPPEATISDSAVVATPQHIAVSPLADRLYFAVGRNLVALDANTFSEVGRIAYPAEISGLATTPSGDRIFVSVAGTPSVEILDRYTGERSQSIELPGPPRALRMDPLGRYLLARPDSGDSVWVVSVGLSRLVATHESQWRRDLPTVASDGAVVTVNGRNVEFVVPGQDRPRMVVRQGANEFWHFVFWNGFRPRAKGLDQPVVFPQDSGTYGFESVNRDTVPPTPPLTRRDSAAGEPVVDQPADTPVAPVTGRTGWTVSFAAILSEERARALASSIRVDGRAAQVLTTNTDGVRVYRVVLGPYPTRREAENVGRASGRSYWVFEGVP